MPEITLTETTDKKEIIDISPAVDIIELLEKAHEIQSKCEDTLIPKISLQRLAVECKDYVTNPTLAFSDENGVRRQVMTDHALSQLCAKLGVPVAYIKKCLAHGLSDLAQTNINQWVDNYDENNRGLFIRSYGDMVRGILSPKYSVFDTPDILDVVHNATRGLDLTVKGSFINSERFHARLVQQEKMKVAGEDLFAGIQIDSSDVGRSTLTVNFFIYKQVCTNGLAISKGGANLFTQKHIGIERKEFEDELVASLKLLPDLIAEWSHIIERCATQFSIFGMSNSEMKSSTTERVNAQLESLIERLKNKTALSKEGLDKVISLAQSRYGFSDWGVCNAITEVAQDYTLERRIELERIAGTMLKAI